MGKIEWTDRSDWNPIRGCTRVSPGCGGANHQGGCYAEAMAARFSDPGMWGHGFAERTLTGGRWTGRVEVQWDRLTLPLTWRKPSRIFASSTSDWFHERLPATEIATLMAVAVAAVHLCGHTFQILTKRSERMREIANDPEFWDQVNAEASAHVLDGCDPLNRRNDDARATLGEYGPDNPPPGIWLGVSVEDQRRADERIPDLLATPAVVRFLSCEPLLGPVDLRQWLHDWLHGWGCNCGWSGTGAEDFCEACGWTGLANGEIGNAKCPSCAAVLDGSSACPQCHRHDGGFGPNSTFIDWIILGGESGPGARPYRYEWARDLIAQCAAAGVPAFHKQVGAHPIGFDGHRVHLRDRKGGDPALWPEDLRVREMAEERS